MDSHFTYNCFGFFSIHVTTICFSWLVILDWVFSRFFSGEEEAFIKSGRESCLEFIWTSNLEINTIKTITKNQNTVQTETWKRRHCLGCQHPVSQSLLSALVHFQSRSFLVCVGIRRQGLKDLVSCHSQGRTGLTGVGSWWLVLVLLVMFQEWSALSVSHSLPPFQIKWNWMTTYKVI